MTSPTAHVQPAIRLSRPVTSFTYSLKQSATSTIAASTQTPIHTAVAAAIAPHVSCGARGRSFSCQLSGFMGAIIYTAIDSISHIVQPPTTSTTTPIAAATVIQNFFIPTALRFSFVVCQHCESISQSLTQARLGNRLAVVVASSVSGVDSSQLSLGATVYVHQSAPANRAVASRYLTAAALRRCQSLP